MKLKNLNRGLVLGAVLIAGTVGYVVYGNVSFKKNMPEIEKSAKNYLTALAKSNVGDQVQTKNQWDELLENYFTDYSNELDYNTKKSTIKTYMNDMEKSTDAFEITKCEVFPKNFTVSKYGDNGATVSFDYTMYLEYHGENEHHMTLWGVEYGGEYNPFATEDIEKWEKEHKDKNMAYKESGKGEIYLLKTDNGWKVATTNSMTDEQSTNYAEDNSSSSDESSVSGEESSAVAEKESSSEESSIIENSSSVTDGSSEEADS